MWIPPFSISGRLGGKPMEQDRRRMDRRQKLKSALGKAFVFIIVLGLAVLAFAIGGTTR